MASVPLVVDATDVREVVAAVVALDVLAAVVLDVESGDDALDGVTDARRSQWLIRARATRRSWTIQEN